MMPSSIHGRPSKLMSKSVELLLIFHVARLFVKCMNGVQRIKVLAGQSLEAQQHSEWCTGWLSLTGKAE